MNIIPTVTNFLENTDIPIPIILIGSKIKKEDAVWNISPDSPLLGVTDALNEKPFFPIRSGFPAILGF